MKFITISAMWCPACLIMRDRINSIKNKYTNFEYFEYDYDLDEEEVLKYNVGDILPVLIIEDNDKEIKRIIGEKKIEEIEEVLRSIL